MWRFKIRGIYATCLARILVDEGFKPVQLSKVLAERLNIKISTEPYDVIIFDTEDHEGICILGKPKAVEEAVAVLKRVFKNSFTIKYAPELYSIYVGTIKECKEGYYIVSLGEYEAVLESRSTYRIGEKVLVTVKRPKPKHVKSERCLVADRIIVSGRYLRLIEGGYHSVSKHIRNVSAKVRLLAITAQKLPSGWGVRWRSSAEYACDEDLTKELTELLTIAAKMRSLRENIDKVESGKVLDGEELAIIYLSNSDLILADNIRNDIRPTLTFHHLAKRSAIELSEYIDYVEENLSMDESVKYGKHTALNLMKDKILTGSHKLAILYLNMHNLKVIEVASNIETIDFDTNMLKAKFNISSIYLSHIKDEKLLDADYVEMYHEFNSPFIKYEFKQKGEKTIGIQYDVGFLAKVDKYALKFYHIPTHIVKVGSTLKVLGESKLEELAKMEVLSNSLKERIYESIRKMQGN